MEKRDEGEEDDDEEKKEERKGEEDEEEKEGTMFTCLCLCKQTSQTKYNYIIIFIASN